MAWRKRFKDKPAIMGILNITPDSFFDGGCFFSETGQSTMPCA